VAYVLFLLWPAIQAPRRQLTLAEPPTEHVGVYVMQGVADRQRADATEN
jgi:hypothetical protein